MDAPADLPEQAEVDFSAIRTDRLILDRLGIGDVDRLIEYKSDPTIALHQAWDTPFTEVHANRLIAATVGDRLAQGGQLAMRTHDGVLAGDMHVSPVKDVPHAVELGITIAPEYHGRGFGSESLRAIVDVLFDGTSVHKIIAYVAAANGSSLRLFDRVGFRREGRLIDSYRARDGSLIEEVLFGLVRADWARRAHQFDVIAFDADDTLWHSEDSFFAAEQTFVDLVTPFVDEGLDVKAALAATERRNLPITGYGVQAFGLSMLETAAGIAGERLPMRVISQLGDVIKQMLLEPVRLLPGVASVLEQLNRTHRLVLITKGDLIHQAAKVKASGLAHHFERVEIVIEKDAEMYARIIEMLGVSPNRFCMVGNSVRSDILPVLSLGSSAVHIPYPLLWDLEQAPHDHGHSFAELESIAQLPAWLTGSTIARAE